MSLCCHLPTAAPPASLTLGTLLIITALPCCLQDVSCPHCTSTLPARPWTMQAAGGAEAPHIQPLPLPFPRQKFKQDLSRRGSRHLPGAFLAIVAPLLCPRRCVFGVTKCKSHFPPSWLALSLRSGLCLFSSPQLVLQCPGELGGSWQPLLISPPSDPALRRLWGAQPS